MTACNKGGLYLISSALLFVCCGCSQQKSPALDDFVALRQQEKLLSRAELRDRHVRGYLYEVASRLAHFSETPLAGPRILWSEVPFAAATDRNEIIISTGLLYELKSEAELAYVLCHEFAHLKLEHTPRPVGGYLSDRAVDDEMAADRSAIECLLSSYYDPHEAFQLLPTLRFHSHSPATAAELKQRIEAVTPLLQKLPRQLFAFRPKRRFVQFQQRLQGVQEAAQQQRAASSPALKSQSEKHSGSPQGSERY